MERLDRLNKMYEYACAKKLCKNKKTFAALLNMNEGNLSSAFSGKDTRYLTNNLLLRANAALGDVFNPSWLLYGEGNMLVSSNTPANYGNDTVTTRQQEEGITSASPSTIDMLLAELKAQRESSDNQISRLLAIIENMTNKQK